MQGKTSMLSYLFFFVWSVLVTTLAQGQELVYLDEPREIWRKTFNAIGEGNGVYLTPSRDTLVAVSRAGILRAYDPADGAVLWTFNPPLVQGASYWSQGGVTFAQTPSLEYLAYMVIHTIAQNVQTRILVVSLDGKMVWESANIPGEGAGSPKISNDGRHVVATHNLDQRGHFSVFDLESSNSTPIYQYESELVVFAETTPFSAIGVYHSPIEGNYDSDSNFGRSNSNDIFVFMTDTNTDVLNPVGEPRAGNGQMYVFQFPVDYFTTQDTSSLAVLPIGNVRNYQARTAPVLANAGQSLYWSMVRGEFRGWVDQRFSRGHTETINFGRGDPAYIAARASPTMSANEEFVYGPGSSNLVFKAARNLVNFTTVATDGIVSSRVAVTLDDQFVVYGTQSGSLAVLVAETMTTKWSTSALNPVKGDLAVDEYRIFVGDDGGNSVGQIVAYEMAYLDQEVSTTTSPSAADRTTGAPSPGPLMDGTAAPTTLVATTTTAPVATTTHAPSLEPTRLSLLESTFKPSAIEATPTTTLAPSRTANVIGGTSGGVAFSFDMNMATMTAVTWVTALVLLW